MYSTVQCPVMILIHIVNIVSHNEFTKNEFMNIQSSSNCCSVEFISANRADCLSIGSLPTDTNIYKYIQIYTNIYKYPWLLN